MIAAAAGSPYSEHDLAVLAAFGEYAAQALVNARRFEVERADSERLRALNAAQAEFSWLRHDPS